MLLNILVEFLRCCRECERNIEAPSREERKALFIFWSWRHFSVLFLWFYANSTTLDPHRLHHNSLFLKTNENMLFSLKLSNFVPLSFHPAGFGRACPIRRLLSATCFPLWFWFYQGCSSSSNTTLKLPPANRRPTSVRVQEADPRSGFRVLVDQIQEFWRCSFWFHSLI